MPSKSQAQNRYMHGVASGSIKPGKNGPSKNVAKEFVAADKGRDISKLPERKSK